MPKKTTTKKVAKKTTKKEAEVKRSSPEIEVPLSSSPEGLVSASQRQGNIGAGAEKYYEAMGRRKESIARIRLYTKKAIDVTEEDRALVTVNNKNYREYFSDANLWSTVEAPLKKLKSINRFKISAVVRGGGKSGQADAIKHGIARTLVLFDQNFRKKLKKSGYLTRDPRAKERRKYGLKKARKAPRWAKR